MNNGSVDDDSDGTEDGLEDSYYAYLNNYFVLERSVVFSRNKYINLNTIYFTYQDLNIYMQKHVIAILNEHFLSNWTYRV